MQTIKRLFSKLHQLLLIGAGVFLVAMIVLTCANIGLRLVWEPIRGTFELMGFFGALATAFALGYTQLKQGHIAVDVLINTFSPRTRKILAAVNAIVCCLFFALVAWQLSLKALVLRATGEVTETLRIAYYPFTLGVAVGTAMLAVVFSVDLYKTLWGDRGSRP
jgi:TRAP-type C4-dicarboxylate transport system permease small subunit